MKKTDAPPTIVAVALAALATPTLATPVSAQAHGPLDAIASWTALDVATGYESRATPALADHMQGWSADRWGNLVATVGSGTPRRVVGCWLDEPAYAASQITDDGYLRVHRIGRGSRHPLWDQAFEAQQVRVLTEGGPVAGVVARSNGHFAQQHRDERAIVGADDLWIDVGASSRAEVAAYGIRLLDPIVRHLPPWPMEGYVAGPSVGARAGCAAVATLAARAMSGMAPAGETHFVLSAQGGLGWVGLSSYVARNGAFDAVLLVAPGEDQRASGSRSVTSLGRFGPVLDRAGVSAVTYLAPAVRSPGAHLEVLAEEEAGALLSSLASALGVSLPVSVAWAMAPAPPELRTGMMDATLARVADVLTDLVERHGVPGHEWAVRRYVLESLPGWARERAIVDDIGNVMVEAGPERDTTVFMAHMDEVGYVVASVAPDGVVALDRLGGAVSSAWEGQTALIHFDPPGAPSTSTGGGVDTDPRWKSRSLAATAEPPLRGVFLTRDRAEEKDPPPERAWFGLDADELAARGLGVGSMVTSYKDGLRMGRARFVARALDDRAGTTALLLAVHAIDPDRLPGKRIFTWSVHEEGGLNGAEAMARRYAATARRIYSIDTFVSSDTPLEAPHFAYAPLGNGPVLRAIENSGVSPDRERARVLAAAAEAGLEIQIGLTQGSTDGTQFTFWGAPNQGLSWPGRYSHSPGEVLDLGDLSELSELIAAVARAGEG